MFSTEPHCHAPPDFGFDFSQIGPGDPSRLRYLVAHRVLPAWLFHQTEAVFDLLAFDDSGWRSQASVISEHAAMMVRRSQKEAPRVNGEYLFGFPDDLNVPGWQAYYVRLPTPQRAGEAFGAVIARREDRPDVPRYFVLQPRQGEVMLVEWRIDARIRFGLLGSHDHLGLQNALTAALSACPHPPLPKGRPVLPVLDGLPDWYRRAA